MPHGLHLDPLMHTIRAGYFGRQYVGTIRGYSSLVIRLDMALGPLVVGFLIDQFGCCRYGFTGLAIVAGLGSICFIVATPPVPQRLTNQSA